MSAHKVLLVGDNPFHNISHLSQERAIARGDDISRPDYAAGLVGTALENGADGFMFSVSETTLEILKQVSKKNLNKQIQIYAIVPYAFEFVRLAVTRGGIPALTKKIGMEIVVSGNLGAMWHGAKGILGTYPSSLLKSYLAYEESRIKSAGGKQSKLASLFLHEVVTDMALALNMEWVFRTHIEFMLRRGIKPGFQTHNFACLVQKLGEWGIDSSKIAIAAQFNSLGFWMCPSREGCEEALRKVPGTEVIAYGILASGYLGVLEAVEYIRKLPELNGLAVGVSKEHHAKKTFKQISDALL